MRKLTELWKLSKDELKRRSRTDKQKAADNAKRRETLAAKVAAWSPEERAEHNEKQRAGRVRRRASSKAYAAK